jgi:DNA-binding transcriptional MocR family regulator
MAAQNDHVNNIRDTCRTNLAAAEHLSHDAEIKLRIPTGGTLLMIQLLETTYSDEAFRHRLLERGIGVISGTVFFHTEWRPNTFVRVALARVPGYFEEGFAGLINAVVSQVKQEVR